MKRITAILATAILAGCTTTVTITKPVFPTPPSELMVSPAKLSPVTDANSALTVIVSNDILLLEDRAQLIAIQKWLNDTNKSINGNPKK